MNLSVEKDFSCSLCSHISEINERIPFSGKGAKAFIEGCL